jgi:chemotaxis protein methyltransferase CheR
MLRFVRQDDECCLPNSWRSCVEFRRQDIRTAQPAGPFDLVLCGNVAFTCFDDLVQRRIVSRLAERMTAEAFLVVGRHESLPSQSPFVPYATALGIYRRTP